jgi:hypothetical protein
MNLFDNTYEKEFSDFITKTEAIKESLMPYADVVKIADVDKALKGFRAKTEDFFREDRKLNIGIIGQVKAGKSTFLNTLLFNGEDVLPKAATPKTAGLTKIEYSEENIIEIEYYSPNEWEDIKRIAQSGRKDNEATVAKEILKMMSLNRLDPYEYLNKGSERIQFSSSGSLMESLNEYVGENGKLTPLVKDVILYINKPELKDISVVDTPGLNDPICSRTAKTQEFIGKCDVVFFLSPADQFVSSTDLSLLTAQLPAEGVQRIILIASRFDEGIDVEEYDEDEALDSIIKDIKRKLNGNASNAITNVMDYNKHHGREKLNRVIEECKRPVYVSSIAYNMSRKSEDDYNEQERLVYDNLNQFGGLDDDDRALDKIGGIAQVQNIFREVVSQKNETLSAKARDFVPTAETQLKMILDSYLKSAQSKLEILKNNDRAEIEEQKDIILARKNSIVADVESIFTEIFENIENRKIETSNSLRTAQSESCRLDEHEEQEWVSKIVRVKDSKWYKPWTWGSSHTEDHGYMKHTAYLDSAEAINNINDFVSQAQNEIEQIFKSTVNISAIKRRLIKTVLANFDSADEKFDPNFFKIIVESNISRITFPVISFNADELRGKVLNNFQGRIKDKGQSQQLRQVLNETVSELFTLTISTMRDNVNDFRQSLSALKDEISKGLIADITEEYNSIILKCEEKGQEISRLEDFSAMLSNYIK